MRHSLLIGFIFLNVITINSLIAQKESFKKDSLQIKVYSEITYKNNLAKEIEIKIKKIFCDYCNNNQNRYLKKLAWDESYKQRFNKKYKQQNGTARLAIYLRISKEEFKKVKESYEE